MKRILLLAVVLLVSSWVSAQLIEVGFEEVYVHPDADVTDAGIDAGAAINYNGFITYQLFAYVEGPDDQVLSVTGEEQNVFVLNVTEDGEQFFQHPANPGAFGPLSQGLLNAGVFNMYQYDSFLTLGYFAEEDAVDGESWSGPTPLVSSGDTWLSDFEAGNSSSISSFFGGGYFTLPTNDAAVATTDDEGNHKVLLGQFTIDASDGNSIQFYGCVEVFPGGEAGDGTLCNVFTSTGDEVIPGCTDPLANNYNPMANLDDGTCDYECAIMINADSLTITDALCFGDVNGVIDATGAISGNQGSISYSLDNEDYSSNPEFGDLAGGMYTLYVLDSQDCPASLDSIMVNSGTEIEVAVDSELTVTPSCNGFSDGSFCVNVTGGVGPYVLALTEEGLAEGSSETCFTDLAGGTYSVWVQDANGCVQVSNGIFLNQPNPINVQTNVQNDATCSYSSDGCIIALGTGGTPVYTYEIEGVVPAQTDNSLCGLAPGPYVVTVTGSNGCSAMSNPVTISSPVELEAIAGDITDVTCFDSVDGEVCVSASGGNGTYVFSADSLEFSTISCFSDLAPGISTYYVQSGECVASIDLEVDAPDEISYEVIQINVDEDCDGSLEVINISGGTGDISVSWEDTDGLVLSTEEITDLCDGESYTLTLEDENGCEVSADASFDITIGLFELDNNISISMFPNPTNGLVNLNIEGLSGQRVSAVIVNAIGEQVSATDFGVLNGLWNNELNLEGEADGIYFVNLTVGEETVTHRVIKQ